MATLTIRNVDEAVKQSLRQRAALHGRSMEEELRQILREVLGRRSLPAKGLGSRIMAKFATEGGVELPSPQRSLARLPPNFEEGSP
jgi:plasmid stability protein